MSILAVGWTFAKAQSGFTPKACWTFDQDPVNFSLEQVHFFKTESPEDLELNQKGRVGASLLFTREDEPWRCFNLGQSETSLKAMTVELLLKGSRDYQGGSIFNWKGRISLEMSSKTLRVEVGTSGESVNLITQLNGAHRLSPGYYADGDWHHLVIRVDAVKGTLDLFVDGESPPEMSTTFPTGLNLNPGSTFLLGSQAEGARLSGEIDELAIYNQALPVNLIRQHFQDASEGLHYSKKIQKDREVSIEPVARMSLENKDFPVNYPNVTDRAEDLMKGYPWPGFKPGNQLPRNIPWVMDWEEFCGNAPKGEEVASAVELQKEMIRNWNYALQVGNVWKASREKQLDARGYLIGEFIRLANDPEFEAVPRLLVTNWQMAKPSVLGGDEAQPLISQSTHPDDHYLKLVQKKKNQKKKLSFAAPQSLASRDGEVQKYLVSVILKRLNQKRIDLVAENGEVNPKHFAPELIENDAALIRDRQKVAPHSSWEGYQALRKTDFRRSYSSQFMNLINQTNAASGFPAARLYWYNLSGGEPAGFQYDTSATLLPVFQGSRRPMPYFYPQEPRLWREHKLATAGLNRMIEGRQAELAAGDSLMCPIVSPGFTDSKGYKIRDEEMIRPGQYLGLLKVLAALGADHFAPFVYYNVPPGSGVEYQPGWRTWKLAMPSYAQAVSSRAAEFFYQGTLLEGDYNGEKEARKNYSLYSFNAGGLSNFVVVRRLHGQKKYLITGTCQPNSNFEGSENTEKEVSILLDGKEIRFKIRRQGSVYIYDASQSAPVFYQLDGWHEAWDPGWWSKEIVLQAELWDEQSGNPSLQTEKKNKGHNFTEFTTSVSASGNTRLKFHFQPRHPEQLKLLPQIRMRKLSPGAASVQVKLNGVSLGNFNSRGSQDWEWQRLAPESKSVWDAQIAKMQLGQTQMVELIWSDGGLEIDQLALKYP